MTLARPHPPCTAARLRHAVRLGLSAEGGARRGPRSAPAGDRAARRARRAGGGRAGRRSGLGEAARRQGADARRQDAGAAARLVLCAQSGDAEPAPALSGGRRDHRARDRHVRIASARISTARTCSKAASASRARSIPAGSTARSPRCSRPGAPAAATPSRSGRLRRWSSAGPAPVLSWTPPRLPPASDDTLMRLLDLYRHTDPALARVLEERMGLDGDCARRRHGRPAAARRRRRAGARLFRRIGRHGGEVSRAAERSAHRRARVRRLGYPRQ